MAYEITRDEARKRLETFTGIRPVWVKHETFSLYRWKNVGMVLNRITSCLMPESGDRVVCTGQDDARCQYCRTQQQIGGVKLNMIGILGSKIPAPFVEICNKNGTWVFWCKETGHWRLNPEEVQ